jgi:hypothetical protein
VARGIALLLFVDIRDRHFVLAVRAKNLVVFYVLRIHGEDFAAIDASEIQQDVHVVHVVHVGRAPWWISRVDTG